MKQGIRRSILLCGDILLIMLASVLATNVRLGWGINVFEAYTEASIFTLVASVLSLYVFDLYTTSQASRKEFVLKLTVSIGLATLAASVLFYAMPDWRFGRGIFAIQVVLVWVFLVLWRGAIFHLFDFYSSKERVVVIGDESGLGGAENFLDSPESPYMVYGTLDIGGRGEQGEQGSGLDALHSLASLAGQTGSRTVILAASRDLSQEEHRLLLRTQLQGIRVMEMATVYERVLGRIPVSYVQERWLLLQGGYDLLTKEYVQRFKRLVDIAFSLVVLCLASPVMLLTALAIRLESPGPVLFRQERVGRDEKPFTILKFRSMRSDAEKAGAQWAVENDPRVTRVGQWIRKFRIDELPQLLNVLQGDMSLVGPRPERPEFVRQLEEHIPFYGLRHAVKPGLTGWAQINYGYGNTEEDALVKLEYELFYIKNMSLFLDLRIILKTLGVVVFGKGAA